ncbi:MAG: hypothetical protein EOO54_17530 [Haliea sp.]|nr:MAG: hypothetical protein EOO54_17530 [Haliea sp.]
MALTALPPPPSTADPANFDAKADAFLGAFPQLRTEINSLEANVVAKEASVVSQVAAANAAGLPDAAANAASALASKNAAAASVTAAAAQVALAATQATNAGNSATAAAASAAAAAAVTGIPNVAGNARKVLAVNAAASGLEWVPGGAVVRLPRTSNTALTPDDQGKYVDVTAGTFSQTFNAAATLGSGWWCYLGNSGAGDVTLDPNGAETIDGLTSFIMYPNEVRLIMCDGAALRSIVLRGFDKSYNSSDTFYKPPGYSVFSALIVGGGASGSAAAGSAQAVQGGGGGGGFPAQVPAMAVQAAEPVTVGAGGVAVSVPGGGSGSAQPGGASTFMGLTVGGGTAALGGYVVAQSVAAAGFQSAASDTNLYGGGYAGASQLGDSIYGGPAGQKTLVGGVGTGPRGIMLGATGGAAYRGAGGGTGSNGVGWGAGGGAANNTTSTYTVPTKGGDGAAGGVRIWGLI